MSETPVASDSYKGLKKEDLIAELERRDNLRAMPNDAEGWLVKTPNPAYTGQTCGVHFRMGEAFIPGAADKVDEILATLEHDFGYEIYPMTVGEYHAD